MLRYAVKVGRPREHDDATAVALLDAGERLLDEEGLKALSLRRVAAEAGTTTRAVYSVFGSKDGLIAALARRAFELLEDSVEALPSTVDPAADLVEAGAAVFRPFALEHASLFRLAIQQSLAPPLLIKPARPAAAEAMAALKARLTRLAETGALSGSSVDTAACEFHALCEGLAAVELRGLLGSAGEQTWRHALRALVAGFAAQQEPSPK